MNITEQRKHGVVLHLSHNLLAHVGLSVTLLHTNLHYVQIEIVMLFIYVLTLIDMYRVNICSNTYIILNYVVC